MDGKKVTRFLDPDGKEIRTKISIEIVNSEEKLKKQLKAIGIEQLQLYVKMLNEDTWDDVTYTSSGFGLIEVFGFKISENGEVSFDPLAQGTNHKSKS